MIRSVPVVFTLIRKEIAAGCPLWSTASDDSRSSENIWCQQNLVVYSHHGFVSLSRVCVLVCILTISKSVPLPVDYVIVPQDQSPIHVSLLITAQLTHCYLFCTLCSVGPLCVCSIALRVGFWICYSWRVGLHECFSPVTGCVAATELQLNTTVQFRRVNLYTLHFYSRACSNALWGLIFGYVVAIMLGFSTFFYHARVRGFGIIKSVSTFFGQALWKP